MITQRRTSITFTAYEVAILAVKDYHGLIISLPTFYSGGPSFKYRPPVLDILDEDFIVFLGPSTQTFGPNDFFHQSFPFMILLIILSFIAILGFFSDDGRVFQ